MIQYIYMGGIVMIPIAAVSIAALALILQKTLAFSRIRKPTSNFLAHLFSQIQKCSWEQAETACRGFAHPLAAIFGAGLAELARGNTDLRSVEETVKLKGDQVIQQMGASLRFLGALVTILPLLGFLGTIVGLIMSFQQWETLGERVTIAQLSGGIYQAMITTAAGLILAIPYYLAHTLLTGRLDRIELEFSNYATEFISRVRNAALAQEEADVSQAYSKTSGGLK